MRSRLSFSSVITVLALLPLLARGIIIELNSGQKFCVADLEKDHTGPEFHVKFFGASYSEGDLVTVKVDLW